MRLMEASQAQNQALIDAATAKAEATDAKLVNVQHEIDALKTVHSQGQALDFSKLDAAMAAEDTQADANLAHAAPPAPAPAPPPAPEPATQKTPYTFAGDPATVDLNVWPKASIETAEATPRPLFNYSGDTAPGQQNGANLDRGAWQVYTGATQPVPAGG